MKTIEDELYIYQDNYEDIRMVKGTRMVKKSRLVSIYLDDNAEEQIDVEFIINDAGEYQLKTLFLNKTWSPHYCFSQVGEHIRLTQVGENCNMIPPDFELHDPVGMTPTEPNEFFRRKGKEDFKSIYEWSREKQDWVIKEEEE